MYSVKCPDCLQDFSRRDVMLRHQRHKHKDMTQSYPPPLSSLKDSEAYPPLPPQSSEAYPPPPPPQSSEAYPPPPPPQSSEAYPPPSPPPQSSEAYPPLPPQSSEAYPPPPPPPPPQSSEAYPTPPPPPPPPPQSSELFTPQKETMMFHHPFTMMVSGPTACGKTTMVKDLLQNHQSEIQPGIQRIVWLYRRWQPLYTVIQNSVIPKVEFIQGNPTDLDEDDFFDSRMNNVLVLDDLFSEAGKDKRITDLFTEGSSHRSLSVISINQNLFGNKDPTQRRNCHYLVLFKNPVDSLSVMTLAKQMYPGNTEYFMKKFVKATKYPYGYLLMDLKPYTPDDQRLRFIEPKSLNTAVGHLTGSIKGKTIPPVCHSAVGTHTDNIVDNGIPETSKNLENISEDIMENKGQACDDCGQLFDTIHDVQRHVKRGWCPEQDDRPFKKQKTEEDVMEIHEDVEDNQGYQYLWYLAAKCGEDKYNELYDRYIANGESEDDATDMAEDRARLYKEKNFFERYQTLLEKYWFPLKNSSTHRSIVDQINDLRRKGNDLTSAVKRTLKRNKHDFQDLFEQDESDEEEDESDDADETIETI